MNTVCQKKKIKFSPVTFKYLLLFFIMVFTFHFSLFTLFADVQEMTTRKSISDYDFPGLKNKISIDLRAMDIIDTLKFFALEGDLNIVAGKGITGSVSLLVNDVTIADALDIVLSVNDLAYQIHGNIIKIISNQEYKVLQGVDFYDQRETRIYQLKYAFPKNVAAILSNIKSDIGKIIFDDSTGTLILIDTPRKVKEMDEIIEKSEIPTVTRILPTETKVFELQYAKVDDISAQITLAISPEIGNIRTDTRTNTMVITDLPHKLKEIEILIEAFDRKPREVFIEAKIVEVTLTDTFKWGIDWDAVIDIASKAGRYTLTPEFSFPLGLSGTFNKMTVNTIQGQDFDLVLEALSTVSETRILSNPHLTVVSGTEATIEVIEKQPYEEETTTTASGGTATTSKSYQWVDVGVLLNVTPEINEDGYIRIHIKPEVSSISEWYGGAAQSAGAVPVVKSANAETMVNIKDGTTIIIAGLIKDQKTKTVNKLPLLGDIPLLGMLFQSISDDVRRTETIVFLTPRIVSGDTPFLLIKDDVKKIKGRRR